MKSMMIEEYGSSEVFVERDIPMPTAGPGEVRVRVKATSVNPIDTKLRKVKLPFARSLPSVLHIDFAGIVDAVGPGISGFKVGDEVYGADGGVHGSKGSVLAEYTVADARLMAHKPKSLSFKDAAVLPLVSISAWEALIDRLAIKPQQKVLVHGGTGGVGHIAIQIARWAGAQVYTTVGRPAQVEIVKALGAHVAINYIDEPVDQYVQNHTEGLGFDAIFDTVGGENLERSLMAVKASGAVASIATGGQHDLTTMYLKGASLHSVLMLLPMLKNQGREHHGEILKRIAELVDTGHIKPLIDPRNFTLAEVGQAHALLESGQAMGKVSVCIS